ncbi:MAG: ATP-binding protein [Lentimicrobium sp.]
MERNIEKALLDWKNSSTRLPMILQGARQVGKTYSLLQFGRKNYKNTAYFNFESSRELHDIFNRDLSPLRILRELSAYTSEAMVPGDTLIVFDEIQSCERALTSLKYFAEEAPQYHIASAGSLLGIAINRNSHSFPVGKVSVLSMYPLDFEEFMNARGKYEAVSLISECYKSNEACSLHETFLDEYRIYIGIGGMPQVVNEFISSGDYNMVMALQKNIIDAYIADMAKYAGTAETVRIMSAFNSVPSQLAKENRKFQYKIIKSGARALQYESAIDWLVASATVNRCTKVLQGRVPLTAYTDTTSFKIYMADTGLLCACYGISPVVFQRESDAWQSIKGLLTENYVSSALTCNGFKPYYWESEGKAEVDFVIQTRSGDIIPVEVKSSDNVRSKSLHQFISRYEPKYSIRISTKNFGFENNIKSVPLYAVFCVKF